MEAFARYNLVRRIGLGGMAEVWKAKATGPEGFEKTVAIKKVLPELADSRDFIAMFVEEAKLVADLVHPNVVQVFDFGQAGRGEYFIAMEYVGGQDLASVLKRAADHAMKMPFEVGLYIVTECAKGLHYAHNKTDSGGRPLGIVHRDMSPQNILLSYGGEVKITDFGIAKFANSGEKTQTGVVRGNAAYLSPEQAETHPLDHRSDIFTLGAVLFELTTGKRLFKGSNLQDLVEQAKNFRFPASEVVHLPQDVQAILQSTLRSDPARRYQDAAEMEEALSEVLDVRHRNEAKRALTTMMQGLFEEERRLEFGVDVAEPATKSISLSKVRPRTKDVVVHDAEQRGPSTAVMADPDRPPSLAGIRRPGPSGVRSPIPLIPASPAQPAPGPIASSGQPAGRPETFTQVLQLEPPTALSSIPTTKSHDSLTPVIGAVPEPPPLVQGTVAPLPPPVPQRSRAKVALVIASIAFAVGFAGMGGARYLGGLSGSATPTPIAAGSRAATPVTSPVVLATAETTAPIATPTALADAPTPKVTAVAVAVARKGKLTVKAAPWCRVFVDGKKVADETPLLDFAISAGRHTVKLDNPAFKFSQTKQIDVKAGERIALWVDVTAKTVSVTRP